MTMIPYLKVDFKPNSILQNRLLRRGLHPFIYYELTLSLVNMESLTVILWLNPKVQKRVSSHSGTMTD